MSLKPLFEGDPIETSVKTIRENLGNVRGNMFTVNADESYTEVLEFAANIEDAGVRKKLVKVARDLKLERERKQEAHKQLDIVCGQLDSLISKGQR